MSLAARLAGFAVDLSWDRIAPLRQKRIRWAAADFYALTAAGAVTEDAWLADVLAHPGDVAVPGLKTTYTRESAILAMGTVGALLQAHDWFKPAGLHGSSVIVPAAWVCWDRARHSVADLLTAIAAGYEITNRLGLLCAVNASPGAAGTSTMGAVGAAAAVSRLMGFDKKTTAAALSMAGVYAPLASVGPMREHASAAPLHNGLAARAGYEAAMMARAGLDAGAHVFEGNNWGQPGFVAFLGGAGAQDALAAFAPETWNLETIDQVFFKDLPACARNQAIVKAVLGLVIDEKVGNDVRAIRIVTDPRTVAFDHTNGAPFGLYDRLMSYRWQVASTLVHGDYGLANLDQGPNEPAVAEMMARITVHASDEFTPGGNRQPGARVEVDTDRGTFAAERRLDFDLPLEAGWFTPYCTPATSMDEAGMERKYFAFAGRSLSRGTAKATLDLLLN